MPLRRNSSVPLGAAPSDVIGAATVVAMSAARFNGALPSADNAW